MLSFIRYIKVNFTFALMNCLRYNEERGLREIEVLFHVNFTVFLVRLKKLVHYTEDFIVRARKIEVPL